MTGQPQTPDQRYAQGQISREEWLRLRKTSLNAPPRRLGHVGKERGSGQAGRVPRAWIALAGVALAVILVIWAVAAGLGGSQFTPSYGNVSQVSASGLGALNASATPGVADASNDTLWFSSSTVHLVVYASPPTHDLSFMIQGLVNPTIHAKAGAHIEVTLVNLDPDMYHNWAIARYGPPYGSMSMMGPGMMMSTAMLDPATGSGFWCQSSAFTANSGTYWYLCQYPGHAAGGMYGSLVFS